MEIVAALSGRELNALVAGIISLVLGFVILAYPPALRIIVALWLFVSGTAAILWALAD
ncbi:MAG TPA: hypothetical protein VG474_13450 [Solirubrobacteraceae bacterium]|nr:hypothetical protein [Solirubrobacteraceae bacterium]